MRDVPGAGISWSVFVVALLPTVFISSTSGAIRDSITPAAPAAVVNGTALVAASGTFELGIHTFGRDRLYLVIQSGDAFVWVANRDKPLPSAAAEAGIFKIDATTGTLVLADAKMGTVFWSSGKSSSGAASLEAKLEDSGNLVLRDGQRILWQSFDHPTDTMLPGMRIGYDSSTGDRRYLSSWKARDDPSPGDYTYSLDPGPLPQLFIRGPGNTTVSYVGYWNGQFFSGVTPTVGSDAATPMFEYQADDKGKWAYFTYNMSVAGFVGRQMLNQSGGIEGFLRKIGGQDEWSRSLQDSPQPLQYNCYNYSACGANSVCADDQQRPCDCLQGFSNAPGSNACVRTQRLSCGGSTGSSFAQIGDVKMPELRDAIVDLRLTTPKQCEDVCAKNCSCIAYTVADISAPKGCIFWNGDLLDMQKFSRIGGQYLFLRQPASGSSSMPGAGREKSPRQLLFTIILPSMVGVTLAVLVAFFIFVRRRKTAVRKGDGDEEDIVKWGEEVPLFDFATIGLATDSFSSSNELGHGGFGVVYKGKLEGGQEVAVKRLTLKSGQGLDEFMNEVKLIARLQHKNLVRLLGCCADKKERILIYEYMQNRSLDTFLFDKQKRSLLDWPKRVSIIQGVARGLLYLHEDSRLKIVHRDLKAANILLDGSMNPKISDFGTARLFEANQQEENTGRVIGTLGYMSPEYATLGIFSAKSDIFSFGVLLLEIITGVKNMKGKSIYSDDDAGFKNLLQVAWRFWQQGKCLDLLDSTLVGTCPSSEVLRYIHIALLCAQESAADRPTMSTVVLMLGSDDYQLPEPTWPGIFHGRSEGASTKSKSCSFQERDSFAIATMTEQDGR